MKKADTIKVLLWFIPIFGIIIIFTVKLLTPTSFTGITMCDSVPNGVTQELEPMYYNGWDISNLSKESSIVVVSDLDYVITAGKYKYIWDIRRYTLF